MKTTSSFLKSIFTVLFISVVSLVWSQSEAIYDISITTTWTAGQHTSVPGSAHWSPLVGATHNTANEFMTVGELATTGIKNVAELGANTVLKGYISDAIMTDGTADQLFEQGFSPNNGDNDNASITNVTISEDFPLITLVSMVAPSPDWFIAINSLDMRSGIPTVNNGWKDDFVMDVFAYDSGTDDGMDYTSANSPNSPVPIFLITGAPIHGNKMATITFDYLSSTLGIEDEEFLKNTKVYPNPVKDILHISNIANTIENVELYNVLGKRIHLMKVDRNGDIAMNVKNLAGGIYILKIQNTKGESLNRKIIIE